MFFIMLNHERTADTADTIEEARSKGQKLCDAEIAPATFAIYNEDIFVENINRSDGRGIDQLIADFNSVFAKKVR